MSLKAIKIFEELKDLLKERYRIGHHLGIAKSDLDAIEEDNPYNSKKRMIEIFSTWLKSDTEASWKKLQTAVHGMGYNAIANQLQIKVDEESAYSLTEVVEQQNAKIATHTHDIEEKKTEFEQVVGQDNAEPPEELNESTMDAHASKLQKLMKWKRQKVMVIGSRRDSMKMSKCNKK